MDNILQFYDFTINNSHIYGGVKYSNIVNTDTDLTVGTTACAEISFTTDSLQSDSLNSWFTYEVRQNGDSKYKRVGQFNIKEITKNTHGKYEVKAYDNIIKFDKVVDSLIDSLTFPITLQNLFIELCSYCGCGIEEIEFTNCNMEVQDNFTGINITGRTVLGYIAQCAGGFARATSNGNIYITPFQNNSITLDNSKYKSFWYADYNAPIIDKVWVGQEDGDIGVTSGTGENVLNIESNPLLFAETSGEIQTYVDNIYNVVHPYSYTPCKLEMFNDFGINAGDIITVDGITTMIMSKSWDNSGVKMESTGNATREINNSQNSEILALRGKTNVLTRTLEETSNKMTSIETNVNAEINGVKTELTTVKTDVSEVKQTANSLSTTVSSVQQDLNSYKSSTNEKISSVESKIDQQADSITNTVTSNVNNYVDGKLSTVNTEISEIKQTTTSLSSTISNVQEGMDDYKNEVNTQLTNMESNITQTAESINSTVSNQGQMITQIQQDLDGINLTYNSTNGTASITIGDVTVSNLVEGKYVDNAVAGINLDGYVTFTDLSTSGSTTISGDNITTGTINADRINMTGSISWGDLTTSCKNTIASQAGGLTEDEVTTLITDELVSSPTIAGGKFTDLNQKNYLKMGSSSDNSVGYLNHYFTPYSTTNPVCVMGYQKGTLPNWVLAPYNVPVLAFARKSSSSGLTAAMGEWDFSSATVTGLDLSGEVTVKAVWGA